MTDHVYVGFETTLNANGEVQFKRVEKSTDGFGSGYVRGNRWPETVDEKVNTDPTLSVFHEPKKGDDNHAVETGAF